MTTTSTKAPPTHACPLAEACSLEEGHDPPCRDEEGALLTSAAEPGEGQVALDVEDQAETEPTLGDAVAAGLAEGIADHAEHVADAVAEVASAGGDGEETPVSAAHEDQPVASKFEEVREVEPADAPPQGEVDDEGADQPAARGEIVHFDPVAAAGRAGSGTSLVPVREELRGLAELAVTLAGAGNLPKALREKPADLLMVLLTARDLGVATTTAIRTFHVIDGTVTLAPKVRAAMVRQQGLGRVWPHQAPRPSHEGGVRLCECGRPDDENDDQVATWHAERVDQPGVLWSSTFTFEDAQRVTFDSWEGPQGNRTKVSKSLVEKDNWSNYPARMLSWRSLGYLLDDAFPEVGTGLYSPDEIGAITDEDGLPVIDVETTEPLVGKQGHGRRARRGSSGASSTGEQGPQADKAADPAEVQEIVQRISALDEPAKQALRLAWRDKQPKLSPVADLLHREIPVAKALVDLIERQSKAGQFGDKADPPAGGSDEPAREAPPTPSAASEPAAPTEEEHTWTADELEAAWAVVIEEVRAMSPTTVKARLMSENENATGDDPTLRAKLVQVLGRKRGIPEQD